MITKQALFWNVDKHLTYSQFIIIAIIKLEIYSRHLHKSYNELQS